MRYYYECESESILSENELRISYEELKANGDIPSEQDSFSLYLMECMDYNNGTLSTLEAEIRREKRILNQYTDEESISDKKQLIDFYESILNGKISDEERRKHIYYPFVPYLFHN